eukprot:CAMPEP_0172192000 /NCGR_PEP_ID=MMETSP1050-20130122/24056_1 /TAXON_ID=233186 /ORGANISM="Cryptomonas curvata, Strain CCAP979/52" /LENGTH=137 /DNA_ID=CAMNT_0012867197 /DNA_START=52 /DNA_END=462 /DNA_ORIENTATION=+
MFRNAGKTFEGDLEIRVYHQYSEPVNASESWQSNECLADETPRNVLRNATPTETSMSPQTEKELIARLMQAQSIAAAKEQGLKAQRNQLQLQLELGAMREALLESRLCEWEARWGDSDEPSHDILDPHTLGIEGLTD